MSSFMRTPKEISIMIANNAKAQRLSLNLSQKSLSQKSGVSYGVLKKFEQSGKISLESLLKISFGLDCLEDFSHLFQKKEDYSSLTLDDLLDKKERQRGRT
jgi:transcriptional regulator with XRE-family HTH domain